ncbi:MAG: hypothetical protein J0L77_08080 [Alphaproteobacteria bacterium]|nr:hypothetical protein [Alphaproteobacteria bacterium]
MAKKSFPTRIKEVRKELTLTVCLAPIPIMFALVAFDLKNDVINLSALWPKTAHPALIEPAKPVQAGTTQGRLLPSP